LKITFSRLYSLPMHQLRQLGRRQLPRWVIWSMTLSRPRNLQAKQGVSAVRCPLGNPCSASLMLREKAVLAAHPGRQRLPIAVRCMRSLEQLKGWSQKHRFDAQLEQDFAFPKINRCSLLFGAKIPFWLRRSVLKTVTFVWRFFDWIALRIMTSRSAIKQRLETDGGRLANIGSRGMTTSRIFAKFMENVY